jgi:hypothetical protein
MLLAATAWLAAVPAAAAPQYVYPAKGQSSATQARDEAQCSTWATQKSGFDPATPAAAPVTPDTKVTGSGARVAGAAGGAVIAGVSGGNAGTGALVGAVGGGLTKRALNHRSARKQNEAAASQRQAGLAAYEQARAACLSGRGYSVK